jgi:hypothetical protein
MRIDGSLLGTRWGPNSAIGPQPRRRHENEVRAGTRTPPWGSRRLPRTLLAGSRRRTLFRELLRRAEGVPVEFADGEPGTVERIVFPVLGFDFWPSELIVATRHGRRRVQRAAVVQIDVREPRILVGASSRQPLERGVSRRHEGRRDGTRLHRLERRRHDLGRRDRGRRSSGASDDATARPDAGR